jgi:mandelamide amidase
MALRRAAAYAEVISTTRGARMTVTHHSRRQFLNRGGAVAAGSLMGATLGGCAAIAGPPSTAEMLAMDSSQALAAMRSGRVSAEQYMAALVARADQLGDLQALIAIDRDGALAAARRVDAMRAGGATLPPLAGLPIVVKDNINTRDLPTTGGTPALRNVRPSANAPSLQKLVDAGAIVLGKSNLHELAFGITSTNLSPFAGPVRNPYDRTRIPGGSSGGTAAAIAARIVTSGLGTDTGGSTRVPAALCGVVGLRPSVGNGGAQRRYTDTNAVVPISHTRDTVGPMGRSVADVALLDAVITGTPPARALTIAGLRIGVPASFWAGLDTQVAGVMAGARAALAATGVRGIGVAEIVAQIASPDVKGAFGAILADAFGAAYDAALNVHRPQMQALYASYFRDNTLDAMMFPTTILPASLIDAVNGSSKVSINGGPPVDTFASFIRNTDPGSNAGIPGLSMPAGLTAAGLPVGLELDGPVGSDARLLGIALAFESVLGRVRPPV